jgi:hypothetical protein
VTNHAPTQDQAGHWLRLSEAAARLGTTVDAVRSRIRRGSLESRRGNDGWIKVMVPTVELDQSPPRPDGADPGRVQATTRQDEGDDWLREDRDEALAEADHWRRLVEDERVARVKAEAEREAERAMLAETRTALAAERARGDRLEAALAEARRPWLAKVFEGLRRKGS